jgi:hypothetical protein
MLASASLVLPPRPKSWRREKNAARIDPSTHSATLTMS